MLKYIHHINLKERNFNKDIFRFWYQDLDFEMNDFYHIFYIRPDRHLKKINK